MLPRQKRPPLGGESQEDNVRRVKANLTDKRTDASWDIFMT